MFHAPTDDGADEWIELHNPGSVAVVSYYLDAEPEGDVTLTIEDGQSVIRTLEATAHAGVNRVTWGLDYDPLGEGGGGNPFAQSNPLVRVPPGAYTAAAETGCTRWPSPTPSSSYRKPGSRWCSW